MTLAIGVVLTVVPQSSRKPGVTADPAARASTTASANTSAPTDPRQQEAARLTAALKRIMAATLPPAQFLPDPAEPHSKPLVFVDKDGYFFATAKIKDSAGTGIINVSVGPKDAAVLESSCPTDPLPHDVTNYQCKVRHGRHGAKGIILSDSIGTHNFQRHLAEIIRSDGNGVSVDVWNGVMQPNYRATRPTPPLTANQTIAVTDDPSLASTVS